jgi:hypothetical protein
VLTIIDEYTCESLAIEVDTSLPALRVATCWGGAKPTSEMTTHPAPDGRPKHVDQNQVDSD